MVANGGTTFRVSARAAPTLFLLLKGRDPIRVENGHVFVPGVRAGDHYAWAIDPACPLLDPSGVQIDRAHSLPGIVPDIVAPPVWNRPHHAMTDLVIYELHVRGLTQHPSSGVQAPGTYLGVAEKAEYLADLGVTAVELLPVHEFDEREPNYWGYSPLLWNAPNRRYANHDPIAEFRQMVQTLHEYGIEVLLDVVYNHTGELGEDGPTRHFRALEGSYAYQSTDRTGCGNTVDCTDERMQSLILDSLRWWHNSLGADGFRFDLATVLSPELVQRIETDPDLAGAKLIAEPWDAAGGHAVQGWYGNERWAVWNDRYRDDVRRIWIEPNHSSQTLATRLCGSSDMFDTPARGVNFITAHDGFTLRDVVSYDRKTNEDGREGEPSANLGDRADQAQRNLMTTLLLSQGIPMIVAGDEWGRSQQGDNNPYDEECWLDWSNRDEEFTAFVKTLMRLRAAQPALRQTRFLTDDDITWIDPDWHRRPGHIAFLIGDLKVSANLGDEDWNDVPARSIVFQHVR